MDLSAYYADTKAVTVAYKNSAGAALDITGATCNLVIELDGTALVTKTVTSFATPATGLATFSLLATDLDLTPGVYRWYADILLGAVRRVVDSGTFTILPR